MVSLQEDEIIKYEYVSPLKINLNFTLTNKELLLDCSQLLFTNKQVIIVLDNKKVLYALYQNIISYGISEEVGTFISEIFNEQEQQQFEQDENQIISSEILEQIESIDFISDHENSMSWIELSCNAQFQINYIQSQQSENKDELLKAYNIFSECFAEFANQDSSEIEGPLDDELITANEINENCLVDFQKISDNNQQLENFEKEDINYSSSEDKDNEDDSQDEEIENIQKKVKKDSSKDLDNN